jgi:hypothetical protein
MVTRVTAKKSTRKGSDTATGVQKNLTDAVAGTLGLRGERMSKVDTAWLRMDSASNLMMIVGVWVIKPGIRYEDLAERLQDRLLHQQLPLCPLKPGHSPHPSLAIRFGGMPSLVRVVCSINVTRWSASSPVS